MSYLENFEFFLVGGWCWKPKSESEVPALATKLLQKVAGRRSKTVWVSRSSSKPIH